jgi:hypothetical protein
VYVEVVPVLSDAQCLDGRGASVIDIRRTFVGLVPSAALVSGLVDYEDNSTLE